MRSGHPWPPWSWSWQPGLISALTPGLRPQGQQWGRLSKISEYAAWPARVAIASLWLISGPRCLHLEDGDLDAEDSLLGDDSWSGGGEDLGRAPLRSCLTPYPEPLFSSSLSHNSMSQESVLCLVEALPSCPRLREASVK